MKTNRALARLLIKDIGDAMARQGLPVPFAGADVLSRAEAQRVLDWARAQPEVRAAYGNRHDKNYEANEVYRQLVNYFAHEHPTDQAGAPEPWPAREGDVTADPASLQPQEAEALLAWFRIQPEFGETYGDAHHPLHKEYVRQVRELTEIASRVTETTPALATQEAAAALERIKQLQADPAYLDRRHPGHGEKVAEMQAAYAAAYPDAQDARRLPYVREPSDASGAPSRADASAPNSRAQPPIRGAPTAQEAAAALKRIKQLQNWPPYLFKDEPGHAEAVAQMQEAYAVAYPEPGARSVSFQRAGEGARPAGGAAAWTSPLGRIKDAGAHRVRELQAHPAYLDASHPLHETMVSMMAAAYADANLELGTEPGSPGRTGQTTRADTRAGAKAPPQQRIRELQAHPAYFDKSHPEHRATVEAMQVAYQQAFPEGERGV